MIFNRRLALLLVVALCSFTVIAGEWYSGWGEDPQSAMKAAINSAKTDSPAGCLCKNFGHDIEALCKKSKFGGVTCKACGSNHAGSCESQAEIDRIVRDVGKLKKLID